MSRYDDDALIAEAVRGRAPGASGWIRFHCPLCEMKLGKTDKKLSGGLNARSFVYRCFKCDASGRLMNPPDEYDLADEEEEVEEPNYVDPPEGFEPLSSHEGQRSIVFAAARKYVQKKRGISAELTAIAGIGACLEGKFGGRVIVPVRDNNKGAWQWFVGRTWADSWRRPYLYPAGTRHNVLYNQCALSVETDEPVLVVEGVFDALSYWPHAVATLGKTTDALLDVLMTAKRPVVLVPDGDAWVEGLGAAMRMRLNGRRAGCLKLPPRVDPDELPRTLLREMALESLCLYP